MPDATSTEPVAVDRRTAVRRGAVVLAGAAGLLAAPALTGTAGADAGDSLLLGGRNSSGDAQTRVSSGTTGATLSLLNDRVRQQNSVGDVDLVSPQLRLAAPVPGTRRPQVPDVRSLAAGDLTAAGGLLYFGAEVGNFDVVPSRVFTSSYATYLQPVAPARATVFDSRTLTAEQRDAAGAEADGRLSAATRFAVDLRSLVNTTDVLPTAAVALSVQVLAAQTSGSVTVFADALSEEGVELLAYAVLPPDVTRNRRPYAVPATGSAVVGLDRDDRLWLALSSPAHLVVRVTGVFVADPTVVVERPGTDTTPYARRVQRQRDAMRRLTAATPIPD